MSENKTSVASHSRDLHVQPGRQLTPMQRWYAAGPCRQTAFVLRMVRLGQLRLPL